MVIADQPHQNPAGCLPEGAGIVVSRGRWETVVEPSQFGRFPFEDGDRLAVSSPQAAAALPRTPDGSLHFQTGRRRYRLPAEFKITPHKGYNFPEHLVVLTGAGTSTLDAYGQIHIDSYKKHMGLEPDMSLLEIGSGMGRDALQLFDFLSEDGRYVGIDVTWDSVEWCARNFTPQWPNFAFHHFDAKHELYNPLGAKTSMDFTLPLSDNSVDRAFLGSVFTHLFEEEITHYLREIGRVLKPDGLAYCNFFLYSDETIASARNNNMTPHNLRFEHAYADGCYVNDAAYPTGAVAFTDDAMRRMMHNAGVSLSRPYLRGFWSGLHQDPEDGQEVAIIAK